MNIITVSGEFSLGVLKESCKRHVSAGELGRTQSVPDGLSQPGLNLTDTGPLLSALNHFVEKSFGVLFLSAFSAPS